MAEDDLFNIDVVRDFICTKGGKVKNHDLVTHFKSFLNDPRCKASNRQKFKEFVNTLAAVKLDETGEKVLVLKKKFRSDEPSTSGVQKKELSKLPAPKAKLKDTFPLRNEDESSSSKVDHEESLFDSIQKELVKSKVQDKKTDPEPDYDQNTTESSAVLEPKPDYADDSCKSMEDPPPDYDTSDKLDNDIKVSDDNKNQVETGNEFLDIKDVPVNNSAIVDNNNVQNQKDTFSVGQSGSGDGKGSMVDGGMETKQPVCGDVVGKLGGSGEVSRESSQGPSSDDGMKTPSRETTPVNSAQTPKEEPFSVKDRAKVLNKISSQSDLMHVPAPKKLNKRADGDGDSHTSMTITLDPVEREWLIASAKADYHPMAKLLNSHPNLSKRKDFVTTALHWAAKHGKVEIVKLLCGAGAAVNARSGYTPLHLASMHSREEVIEILVETYGADSNIRDYSGKKPKQYLKNAASSRVQQLLQARRSSQSIGFKRSGSYSSKIGTAAHFGIKAGTAVRSSWVDNGRHSMSRSPSESPKNMRKNYNSAEDMFLMPPPHDVPMRKKKSKRHPVDSFNSQSNPEINRSGSDPFLSGSDPTINKPVHQSSSYTSFV